MWLAVLYQVRVQEQEPHPSEICSGKGFTQRNLVVTGWSMCCRLRPVPTRSGEGRRGWKRNRRRRMKGGKGNSRRNMPKRSKVWCKGNNVWGWRIKLSQYVLETSSQQLQLFIETGCVLVVYSEDNFFLCSWNHEVFSYEIFPTRTKYPVKRTCLGGRCYHLLCL